MKEMVERVARAICRVRHDRPNRTWSESYSLDDEVENSWDLWVNEARAAIEAMREPTLDMIHAAPSDYITEPMFPGSPQMVTRRKLLGPSPEDYWRAMIDAALKDRTVA